MPDRNRDISRFGRAAKQRLTAAELLFNHGFRLEAIYIAGYAIECGLKALVLRRTPRGQHSSMLNKLTRVGSKGHDFEYHRGILIQAPLHCVLPKKIIEALRTASSWSTDLRYETGFGNLRVARKFLDAAQDVVGWAERS